MTRAEPVTGRTARAQRADIQAMTEQAGLLRMRRIRSVVRARSLATAPLGCRSLANRSRRRLVAPTRTAGSPASGWSRRVVAPIRTAGSRASRSRRRTAAPSPRAGSPATTGAQRNRATFRRGTTLETYRTPSATPRRRTRAGRRTEARCRRAGYERVVRCRSGAGERRCRRLPDRSTRGVRAGRRHFRQPGAGGRPAGRRAGRSGWPRERVRVGRRTLRCPAAGRHLARRRRGVPAMSQVARAELPAAGPRQSPGPWRPRRAGPMTGRSTPAERRTPAPRRPARAARNPTRTPTSQAGRRARRTASWAGRRARPTVQGRAGRAKTLTARRGTLRTHPADPPGNLPGRRTNPAKRRADPGPPWRPGPSWASRGRSR
jgi:hypothetical protein